MPTAPPPATFPQQEKEGLGMAPRWDRQNGWRAKRTGVVTTADPEAVMLAPNLPANMAQYSLDYPMLYCVRKTPEHKGGKTWHVHCDYETVLWNAGSPTDPPPPEMPPLTTYCVPSSVQESIMMTEEVDDAGAVVYNDQKINNGDGMPAYVGRTEFTVVRYYATGDVPDIDYFASLDGFPKKLNNGPIKMPVLQGTTLRYTIAAEKLLYMGFKMGVTQSGLPVATHTLWFANDHRYLETQYNAQGLATVSTFRKRYAKANFAALWAQ